MRAMRVLAALCALAVMGNAGTYTVRSGDTLDRIARRLGTTSRALAEANDIRDRDLVLVGQVLQVPPGAGAAEAAPTARHVVRKGEHLAGIARRWGTTVGALRRLNALRDPHRIRVGQSLLVPAPAGPAPAAATPEEPAPALAGTCPVKGATRHDVSDGWRARRAGGLHLGNDIFARRGTPVLANVSGTLSLAHGGRAGLAYYLRGDDGHTYYGAHLAALHVRPGRVHEGQQIGTVGSTGNARGTPPHLHFEIKLHGGPPVDPHPTLTAWC